MNVPSISNHFGNKNIYSTGSKYKYKNQNMQNPGVYTISDIIGDKPGIFIFDICRSSANHENRNHNFIQEYKEMYPNINEVLLSNYTLRELETIRNRIKNALNNQFLKNGKPIPETNNKIKYKIKVPIGNEGEDEGEGEYKKGGKIPKSGLYRLHKGEVVVPAHRVKTVDNALKKAGRKPLKKVCKTCVLSKKQLAARKVIKTKNIRKR